MRVKEPFNNVKSMTRLPPKGLTVKGIVHWNDLTRNEINQVLFFQKVKSVFSLVGEVRIVMKQNIICIFPKLSYVQDVVWTVISVLSNHQRHSNFVGFLCLEASLDKIRIISTKPRTVLFVRFFFPLVHTSVYFYRSSSISLHGY